MSMDRSRRDRFTNVAPTADEFKAAALLAGLLLFLLVPLVVQGILVWTISGNFALPKWHFLDAYDGLLHGRFGQGLRRGAATALPPDAVLWVLTAVGEVLTLGVAVVIGRWMRELTGASSRHGLATPTQAANALGVPRLRSNARVIRPDLYARSRTARPPGQTPGR